MIPGSFDYHVPKTIGEAIKLLDDLGEDAKILAGGHSLIPMMKWRLAEPTHLVDISRLSGLDYIKEEDGYLCIGAMATETALETNDLIANKYSILKDTSEVIADPLVRNLATLGGNIAHGDPANDHPATMLAMDAVVVACGPNESRREIKIDDFFLGPLWTALEENEILTEIKIPMPQNDTGGCYIKLERKVGDYAIAAAAVRLEFDNEKCASAGIALTNVGPTPVRATEAQNALIGTDVSDDLVDQASILAAEASQPIGDHRGSEEYKRGVVKTLTGRAIMKAKTRAFGGN
tara:strand:+ start:1590 stop:2465 length:876 start_codon:yes stop_codon:yes gene_type:complete